jgi:hypothetical protein
MLYYVQQNEPEAEPLVNIEPFVLASPAKGDAYDFSVTLLRTATSAGKRARALLNDEVPEAEAVLQRACQEVRSITRRFEITEAGAAEQAANEKLRSVSGSMTGAYRWTVRAEVNVPEEIRQLNRDSHRKLHDIRSDAAAALLQIKSTDEVRQKWQEFLAAVEGSARVVHAIQLAVAPEHLPQIIDSRERRNCSVPSTGSCRATRRWTCSTLSSATNQCSGAPWSSSVCPFHRWRTTRCW